MNNSSEFILLRIFFTFVEVPLYATPLFKRIGIVNEDFKRPEWLQCMSETINGQMKRPFRKENCVNCRVDVVNVLVGSVTGGVMEVLERQRLGKWHFLDIFSEHKIKKQEL